MALGPVPAQAASSAGAGPANPYRVAIDDTLAVLAARARSYRALILVVALGTIGPCVWAIVARSFTPVVFVALVVASVGAFFWFDALRLNRWRARLLAAWRRREVDFSAFGAAITAVPGLPAETVAAMLASLPQAPDLAGERAWDAGTRAGMADAVLARDRRHAALLLLKTALVTAAWVGGGAVLLMM